jgi:hypothetical protein
LHFDRHNKFDSHVLLQRVVLTDPVLVAEVLQNNKLKKGGNYGPFRKVGFPCLMLDEVFKYETLH